MLASGRVSARNLGLDLLRALAISFVLICHFGDVCSPLYGLKSPSYVSLSGMFGVELFFVLSGFLIGNLLLDIIGSAPDWRSWLIFMVRRWMRTLPLYLLWLVVLIIVWPPPHQSWSHFTQYATLSQNLLWPMPHDNWFGVSWSLTVEEWFYILFSAALIGVVVIGGSAKWTWCVIGTFIVVPIALRLAFPQAGDWGLTTYKIAAMRLDAIAYGVALAKLATSRSALFRYPFLSLGVGLATIVFVWAHASGHPLVPLSGSVFQNIMLTLTSVGFALCFPAAIRLTDGRGWIAATVRQISAQSYGLYIMHLSIIEVVIFGGVYQHRLGATPGVLIAVGSSFLLSYLSFRYFEMPILKRRPRQYARRSDMIGSGAKVELDRPEPIADLYTAR